MQGTCFDNLVADFVRLSHIPLAYAELLLQFACIAVTLFCCRRIAARLFKDPWEQWAGVALVAAMFTLPVAGTALLIFDQHLHPRSMATALILLAVSRILDRHWLQALPILVVSALIHPIMTLFGISFCVFLTLALIGNALQPPRKPVAIQQGVGTAAFAPLGALAQTPTPLWFKALETKNYLLLNDGVDEWPAAVAPLLLFCALWRFAKTRGQTLLARFALAVASFGAFHLMLAVLVWRIPALVRLTPFQPMRFLHLVYVFMALLGGCLMGRYFLKKSLWRWAAFLLLFNAGMFAAQRYQYGASPHIELPGSVVANPWLQAFSWIRDNTPTDAFFAIDPFYLAAPGEDYHGFRALAERSQLADSMKDAAVVGLFPTLAPEWDRQTRALEGWPRFQLADFERLKSTFGVGWTLVSYPPPQGLSCRWHNAALSVCQIP